FQAEDGIRDRNVTGVQTCALPISGGKSGDAPPADRGCGRGGAYSWGCCAGRSCEPFNQVPGVGLKSLFPSLWALREIVLEAPGEIGRASGRARVWVSGVVGKCNGW